MTEQSLLLLMLGCAAGGFVIGYLFGGMTYARGDDLIEDERQPPDISCKSPPAPPPARDPRGAKPKQTPGFKRKLETTWPSPGPKKPPERR